MKRCEKVTDVGIEKLAENLEGFTSLERIHLHFPM